VNIATTTNGALFRLDGIFPDIAKYWARSVFSRQCTTKTAAGPSSGLSTPEVATSDLSEFVSSDCAFASAAAAIDSPERCTDGLPLKDVNGPAFERQARIPPRLLGFFSRLGVRRDNSNFLPDPQGHFSLRGTLPLSDRSRFPLEQHRIGNELHASQLHAGQTTGDLQFTAVQ
jgi:hypothetical protein